MYRVHLKSLLVICFLLFLKSAISQRRVDIPIRQIKPIDKIFSQAEIKLFYGPGRRAFKTDDFNQINKDHYDDLARGNELSFEAALHIRKNFYASLSYSRFTTFSESGALRVNADQGNGFFILINDKMKFQRSGLGVNFQKQIWPKSFLRYNIGAGAFASDVNDYLRLRGPDGAFTVHSKNETKIAAYFQLGFSTSVTKYVHIHVRYLRYYGNLGRLYHQENKSSENYFEFTGHNLDKLNQNSFQVGVSWLFAIKK